MSRSVAGAGRKALRLALLVATVGGCAGAWWIFATPEEPAAPDAGTAAGFTIPDGAFRPYDLTWRSEARLQLENAGGPQARGWTLEGRARLHLKYFTGDTGWNVAARMEGTSVQLDGEPGVPAPGFERPFSFHQDRHGYLTDFTWPAGLPEQTRVLLRQSISRLQVVLSMREAQAWNTRERDALGVFRAAYTVSPPRGLVLRKQKLHYLPAADRSTEDGPIAQQIVESNAELELLPGAAGLARARIRETLSIEEAHAFVGTETTEFEARLVEAPDGFDRDFRTFAADRDRPFVAAPEPVEAPGTPLPNAPASLKEALRAFSELFGRDRQAAEAAVLAWLRSGAAAPKELVSFLEECSRGRHPSWDGAQQAVLFRLLAQAGTPEALDALLTAASSDAYHLRTRRLAVGHMDQVPVAQERQIDVLLALHFEQRRTGGLDAAELANMALLATGALAHRDLGSPQVSTRVVEELSARLSTARSVEERVELLAAMGNCGDARLLEASAGALSDAEPAVRAAAARSLRRTGSAEVPPLLLRRYLEETDPGTRAALVEVLGRGAPTEELLRWARQEAQRPGDATVQLALVDLLGTSLPKAPANEEALRRVLESSPGRKVEQRILRYIAPRPRR